MTEESRRLWGLWLMSDELFKNMSHPNAEELLTIAQFAERNYIFGYDQAIKDMQEILLK